MADISGPWDTVSWSESDWYRHMSAAIRSGVIGVRQSSATAGPLGWSASGRVISLQAGTANVGGAGYSRTAPVTSTSVPANAHSSLSRRDRIVLRRSLTSHTVTPTIITGTAAASPTVPAITRNTTTWDLPLFNFLTPPSSGTTLTSIRDERAWVDDGTETAAPGTQALLEGTGTQSISSSSLTVVNLTIVTRDDGMTAASGRITAEAAGVYLCSGAVTFSANTTNQRFSRLRKNGTDLYQTTNSSSPANVNWRVPTAVYPVQMVSGDYIELVGYQESTSTLNMLLNESFLQATWIGPL